jgi:hypothetical protein
MGIYSSLEDKWYGLLEKIDKLVPVLWLTDKIDKIFPSFILFLFVILILLILGIYFAGEFGSAQKLEAKVVVETAAGDPIEGAIVSLNQNCAENEQELSIATTATGAAEFSACSEEITVNVSKEAFAAIDKDLDLTAQKVHTIVLLPKTVPPKQFTAKVIDKQNKIISSAKLTLTCIKGTDINKIEINPNSVQPSAGFKFNLPTNCTTLQLTASSTKHKQQTVTIGVNDETKNIQLEELILSGSVNFIITSSAGLVSNAQVTVRDELGAEETRSTSSNGQTIFANKNAGSYTYMIFASGYNNLSGDFSLSAGETKEVEVDLHDSIPVTDNSKYINYKVVDNNTGVASEARIFYSKGMDMNYLTTRSTGLNGTMDPVQILDTNRKHYAIIKSGGYKTALVELSQKSKVDAPQVIPMQQGGVKLKVNVVDDQDKPISGVKTFLFLNTFPLYFDTANSTDANGVAYYSNLPNGTFKLTGATLTEEGSIEGINIAGTDMEVTLKLLVGKGNIAFNLYGEEGKANALCEIFEKNPSGAFESRSILNSTNGTCTAVSINATKQIQLKVNDANYIPYEGFAYTATRTNQTRTIFLRKQSQLPNQNPVQLILKQVYPSNPINGKEQSKATQLMPGTSYFFLFDAIINKNETGNFTANFFVGPSDKNTLYNSKIAIYSAYSIPSSASILSKTMNGFAITSSAANPQIVDSNAKQLNVLVNNLQGLKTFPILVEIRVDDNAKGNAELYWNAKFNNYTSLNYNFKTDIGSTFCFPGIDNCPAFLFSNYLKWGNRGFAPIGEDDVSTLQIDDNYVLKVIAKNNTDQAIGDANLALAVQKDAINYVSFFNDANTISRKINLTPLGSAEEKEFSLIPKNPAVGSAKIYETVQKIAGGYDTLSSLNSSAQYLRFGVKNKEQLLAVLVATQTENVVYERESYPIAYIKTRYSPNKPVSANWKLYIEGQESTPLRTGKTDANGTQVVSGLDLSNVAKGTKLFLKAEDDNGALPAVKEIKVVSALPDEIIPVSECVHALISGADASTMPQAVINLDVNQTGSFTVKSECDSVRKINIQSDLEVSSKQFDLGAGEAKIIGVNPAPGVALKNGMLGAYPVLITSTSGGEISRVALIDVVVKDSTSCFDLDKAIYDLRATGKISGKITNKCFSGRKDNYYPQMNISTNSVTLSYKKPGNPEKIDLNVVVIGSALEGLVNGATGITVAYFTARGKGGMNFSATRGFSKHTSSPVLADEVAAYCEELALRGSESIDRPEPDLNSYWGQFTDPEKPLYRVPTAKDYSASSLVSTAAKTKAKVGYFAPSSSGLAFPINDPDGVTWEYAPNPGALPSYYAENAAAAASGVPSTSADSDAVYNKFNNISSNHGELYSGPSEGDNTNPWGVAAGGLSIPPDYDEWDFYSEEVRPMMTSPRRWYSTVPAVDTPGNDGGFFGGVVVQSDEAIGGGHILLENAAYVGSGRTYLKVGVWGGHTHNTIGSRNNHTSRLAIQNEFSRLGKQIIERKKIWSKVTPLNVVEGSVQQVGKYQATPTPLWTGLTKVGGRSTRDDMECGHASCSLLSCLTPTSYVQPESLDGYVNGCIVGDTTCEADLSHWGTNEGGTFYPSWVIRPVEDPLVEYSDDGKIMYYIPQDKIPEGVRMFLRDKKVYAEYVGKPEIASPDIDFNITKVNLLGQEYAVVTVGDWIGDHKEIKAFQIKLKGNPTNCYLGDGTPGITGREFVPRVLFNWDWNAITMDQCDASNSNYTYCDATQFSMELFQKLKKINELVLRGRFQDIPKYSAFYSYLIKDNYSQDFLQDFKDYYSSNVFSGSAFFVSTPSRKGFDQFISSPARDGSNRIKFKQRNSDGLLVDGGNLPRGGLYRVELGLNFDNPNLFSLFDNNSPNASVDVTFKFVQAPKNNNPFYETPFDGEIGKNGSSYVRKNYGSSISTGELKLSPSAKAYPYSNSLNPIAFQSISDLTILNNRILLSYSASPKSIYFIPSVIAPVLVTVKSADGKATMQYKLEGDATALGLVKSWRLTNSTVNRRACADFANSSEKIFTEKVAGNGTKSLSWNGSKPGELVLSTAFFVPQNTPQQIMLKSLSDATMAKFNSYDYLTGPSTVQLSNYLSGEGFDSLQKIFDSVGDEKMCMTQNSEQVMKIWWNQDYIDSLIEELAAGKTNCLPAS